MKSSTRTVLSPVTLTNVTSYSSGPLYVGDLEALAFDVNVTQFGTVGSSYPFLNISRIGIDGTTYSIGGMQLGGVQKLEASIGTGLQQNALFGDQIQIDLLNSSNVTLSATISLYGK